MKRRRRRGLCSFPLWTSRVRALPWTGRKIQSRPSGSIRGSSPRRVTECARLSPPLTVLRELRMIAVNVEPKMGGLLMKELSSAAPFQVRCTSTSRGATRRSPPT